MPPKSLAQKKREIDILVLSDIHLGTYGCRAKELLNYLESIEPKHIILNGDIIDIWQFSKHYWPKNHMKVVRKILKFVSNGVQVDYITGNHDEMLRKFEGFELGTLKISNKLLLDQNGSKMWFFHGDVFDVTMKHSKWLAKLGAMGYDFLILINTAMNWFLRKLGREKYSLSKKVKNTVKGALKFINDFEQIAADIAIANQYDVVACGHIHQPAIRLVENHQGAVIYLNSGDWIENLTALEYSQGKWSLYQHEEVKPELESRFWDYDNVSKNNSQLFEALLIEFEGLNITKST